MKLTKKKEARKISGILNRAWALQSKLVRYRAGGFCRTCENTYPPLSSEFHAGHMVHTGNGWNIVDFNMALERIGLKDNIYGQCMVCNRYHSGKRDVMLRKFLNEHPVSDYDMIVAARHRVWKPTLQEAERLLAGYKAACEIDGIL